jgi:hypothetical protein
MAVLELGIFPAAIGYAAWAFVVGHMGQRARGAAVSAAADNAGAGI